MEQFQCIKSQRDDEVFKMQEASLPISHAHTPEHHNNATSLSLSSSTSAQLQKVDELAKLLKEWNLFEQLYSFLKASGITIEGLKCIKERHLDQLFAGENLNTKIIFEHKLTLWQQNFGIYYLLPHATPITVPPATISVRSPTQNIDRGSAIKFKGLQSCELTKTSEALKRTRIEYPEEKPVYGTCTIRHILCITEDGKRLLETYNEMQILLAPHRTAIVHKIVQYFIESNIMITVKLCKRIAEQIIIVFPTEKLETYFSQTNSKVAPKGKIWDRYQSRKRRLKGLRSIEAKKN